MAILLRVHENPGSLPGQPPGQTGVVVVLVGQEHIQILTGDGQLKKSVPESLPAFPVLKSGIDQKASLSRTAGNQVDLDRVYCVHGVAEGDLIYAWNSFDHGWYTSFSFDVNGKPP